MRVIETRTTQEGFKRRRYESALGVRYSTIEVPFEVWRGINSAGRGENRASAWARARQRETREKQAVALVKQGWKPVAVASQFGVNVATVYRWVQAVK